MKSYMLIKVKLHVGFVTCCICCIGSITPATLSRVIPNTVKDTYLYEIFFLFNVNVHKNKNIIL